VTGGAINLVPSVTDVARQLQWADNGWDIINHIKKT
jgi:hypothetical protein